MQEKNADLREMSSTRRRNTKKRDGASVRMSATSRRNAKKSTGGAPARAGRCRQLDDVIRRRDTEKRIFGN